MKKIICILAIVALMAAFLVPSVFAAEAPQFVVESKTATGGEEIVLTVSLANNPGITNGKIDVTFDETGLEFVKIDTSTGVLANVMAFSNGPAMNFMTFMNINGDGILFSIVLKVKDDAAGDYNVGLAVEYINNENDEVVEFEVVAGTVSVTHECTKLEDVAEVAATCTTEGVKAHQKCSCGKLYVDGVEVTAEDLVIALADHTFGEWTETKAATETEKGEEQRVCTVCGYAETRETDVLPHTCVLEDVAEVAATCTTEGVKAHQKCFCGKLYLDGVEVTAADLVIATVAHTFGEWTETKAPTCTEEGEKTHTCEVCGAVETEAVEKLAHVAVEGGEIKYDEKGHWYLCECGETTDYAEHTYGEGVKGEDGMTVYTCTVCGYAHSVEELPPTGDMTAVVFALVAVSGMGLVALTKKKED